MSTTHHEDLFCLIFLNQHRLQYLVNLSKEWEQAVYNVLGRTRYGTARHEGEKRACHSPYSASAPFNFNCIKSISVSCCSGINVPVAHKVRFAPALRWNLLNFHTLAR